MRSDTLRQLRRYHHYLGVFFAPFILLFAVSGALQTFRLQEAKGYGGAPPAWIVWLASVHKDQGPPRAPKAQSNSVSARAVPAKPRSQDAQAGPKRPSPLPLKIFVVLLATALSLSTIMGIVIALANKAMRRTSIVLLLLGAVVPCGLLWI